MAYYIEINTDGTPKTNSIVLTSKEGYPSPLLDITASVAKKQPGSGREIIQPRYFIKTTSAYVPLSGTVTTTRPTTGKYVDITDSYVAQTMIDAYLLDESSLYALVIVGNSNATNMSNQPRPVGFVNTSINSNKKVEWNDDESAMIIADNILTTPQDRLAQHIFQPTFYGENNPAVLMANEMSRIIKEVTGKTIQFISVSGSANGAMIDNGADNSFAELSNNSIHFQYLQQGLQAAKTYATSIGKGFKVPFVVLLNGEVEAIRFPNIPESEYRFRSTLATYRRNLQNMVHAITGDTYNFPIFRHQFHAQQTTDVRNMDVKQIVLNSSSSDFPVILSTYHLSILMNFDHWDTEAAFRMFGYFTRTMFRHLYQKNGVIFKPSKFTVVGNNISIKVNVPTLPLKIDTSRGTETNHGFTLIGADTNEISLSNVAVNNDTVTMTAATNPVGATLYYKLKRPYAPDLNRFGSYIADSDNVEAYGFTLWNYLLSFKQVLV